MSFVSPEFALVALFFFPVFWSLKTYRRVQLGFLTAGSYLLYTSWSPAAAISLCALSIFVWGSGNLINMLPASGRLKGLALAVGILLTASLLLVTKYYDFCRQLVVDILPDAGLQHLLPVVDFVVPAGISFFTFQAITFLVWRFRSEQRVIPVLQVLAFLSFWPTLFAGPILRAEHFFEQITSDEFGQPVEVPRAFYFILLGLAEKLIFENWLADSFVDSAFRYPESLDLLSALAAMWGYALQIFFDFAGYSLIVIGLGLLLGYRIPDNFRQPYLARNLREFWRGWHISLSTFIRDYIYIPMGGSRVGVYRTQFNVFIAMVISGIWHGAALTFLMWGVLHGIGVVIIHVADRSGIRLPAWMSHVITLVYLTFAWVFFRAASVDDAWSFFHALTVAPHGFEMRYLWLLAGTVVFFGASARVQRIEAWSCGLIARLRSWQLVVAASLVAYCIIYLGPNGIPDFIYYRF